VRLLPDASTEKTPVTRCQLNWGQFCSGDLAVRSMAARAKY
jgi:hypothetical protein